MANPVLERVPQLRRVTNMAVCRRALSIARQHRLVEARVRFVVAELRGGTRSHRLASDPKHCVVVRHRTRDMEIFDEVFRPPMIYEPPPAPAEALRRIAAGRSLRVLDLGANVGLFAVYALSCYPEAEVASYEPEPGNIRLLERCAAKNDAGKWDLVHACAMTMDETVRITLGGFADSYVTDAGVEVAGVDVLPLLGGYDFVKMDIEGSEWPILHDPRWPDAMRDVAVFVLEWHDRGCSVADPRAAAIAAIEAAGLVAEPGPPGWDHGVVWGWRQDSQPDMQ